MYIRKVQLNLDSDSNHTGDLTGTQFAVRGHPYSTYTKGLNDALTH